MRYLPVLLALLVMEGCVLIDGNIEGRYQASPIKNKSFAIPIVLAPLEYVPTMKNDETAVGVKKNGYGMETAKMILEPSPQRWLHDAVVAELAAVQVKPVAFTGSEPMVKFKVEQFFVEPAVGFWGADVTGRTTVVVQIYWPTVHRMFERRFVGAEESFEMLWLDSAAEAVLQKSAQRAMTHAAQAVRSMLEGSAQ
jgi:hypothetical protein